MEPTLPIIRLARTTDQNVRLANDPLDASITFYTFLRGVPSKVEQQYAMQDLRRHASGYYTDSHATLSSFGHRERALQQLEAAVFDGLLRYPPAVSASWCREHRQECLRPLYAAEPRTQVCEESNILSALSTASSSPTAGRPPSHEDLPHLHQDESSSLSRREHIGAQLLHQFTDPFTDYEQTRRAWPHPRSDANLSVALSSIAGEMEPMSGETTPTRLLPRRSATRPPDDVREQQNDSRQFGSEKGGDASVSSLEETSRFVTPAVTLEERLAPSPAPSTALGQHPVNDGPGSVSNLHPVSALVLAQVRTMNRQQLREPDAQDAAFLAAMQQKVKETSQRLDDAQVALKARADLNAEARSIWCTSHAHYKASEAYLVELQRRLHAASRLFQVQRREQETVQAAHLAIALETTTLSLLLRDVERCADTAATRLDALTTELPETLDDVTRQEAQIDMTFLVALRGLLAPSTS